MPSYSAVLGIATGSFAAVFVASGIPKVRRPFGIALALVRFGVARAVDPRAGRALGTVEILLGASFVLVPVPFVPALVAAGLLIAFTAVVVPAMRRGQAFDCACFGVAERIGWSTVVRNIVLSAAAVGAAVALRPGAAVPLHAADRYAGLLVGTLLICGYLLMVTMAEVKPFATRLDHEREGPADA